MLVMGDFNSPQTGRDAGAYEIATGSASAFPVPKEFADKFPLSIKSKTDGEKATQPFALIDIKAQTPRQFISGHYATYTGKCLLPIMLKKQGDIQNRYTDSDLLNVGFVSPPNSSNYVRIDFIFGGSNGGW